MKKIITLGIISGLAVLAMAGSASAAQQCPAGGTQWGPQGLAHFANVRTHGGMNCASVRYVMNKWVKRSYARTGRLRFTFYDGYVTWYCGRDSSIGEGYGWRCHEYDSGTSFTFSAWRTYGPDY